MKYLSRNIISYIVLQLAVPPHITLVIEELATIYIYPVPVRHVQLFLTNLQTHVVRSDECDVDRARLFICSCLSLIYSMESRVGSGRKQERFR
jgi:hypothetical protein